MAEKRRKFSSEEKVRILRWHFVEKVPVSDLCDEFELHLTVFHRSQKRFFENRAVVFQRHGQALWANLSDAPDRDCSYQSTWRNCPARSPAAPSSTR